MTVERGQAGAVVDLHGLAVTSQPIAGDHRAVGGGPNLGAILSREVATFVDSATSIDRVNTGSLT